MSECPFPEPGELKCPWHETDMFYGNWVPWINERGMQIGYAREYVCDEDHGGRGKLRYVMLALDSEEAAMKRAPERWSQAKIAAGQAELDEKRRLEDEYDRDRRERGEIPDVGEEARVADADGAGGQGLRGEDPR